MRRVTISIGITISTVRSPLIERMNSAWRRNEPKDRKKSVSRYETRCPLQTVLNAVIQNQTFWDKALISDASFALPF